MVCAELVQTHRRELEFAISIWFLFDIGRKLQCAENTVILSPCSL